MYIITVIFTSCFAFGMYHFLRWYEEAKAAGAVSRDYITKE